MGAGTNSPTDSQGEEGALRRHGADLAAAVVEAVPGWIERSVAERARQWHGHVAPDTAAAARCAGREAAARIGPRLSELLQADIDRQRANPLALLRDLVPLASAVLERAGVPHVERDELDERINPDDVYALAPATWSDVDQSLHEPGLRWSAAKAYLHKARHRPGEPGADQ